MSLIAASKRTLIIGYYTFVMYFVTHMIVLFLFPLWFIVPFFRPGQIPALKVFFATSIFRILNKKIEVTGYNNFDSNRKYLLLANYPSGYAGFVMMFVFPKASIVAHDFMSRVPLISNMLEQYGFIFVHKKGYGKTKSSMNKIINQSKSNNIILLPEGKITRDGNIQEFQRGFIYLARKSSLNILPVTLNGLYTLKAFMRPYVDPDGQPKAIIHEPIQQNAIANMNDEQLMQEVHRRIVESYAP